MSKCQKGFDWSSWVTREWYCARHLERGSVMGGIGFHTSCLRKCSRLLNLLQLSPVLWPFTHSLLPGMCFVSVDVSPIIKARSHHWIRVTWMLLNIFWKPSLSKCRLYTLQIIFLLKHENFIKNVFWLYTPNSLQIHPHLYLHSTLCPHFILFFFKPIKASLCCLYSHPLKHCSPPGGYALKENEFSSPS